MKPESKALCQVLLDHHALTTKLHPPTSNLIVANYLIRYGDLCNRAGVPHLTRIVGRFLIEIAEWCEDNDYPPLNSLAVNDTGMPGDAYDEAGGFKIINWPSDVDDCICFAGYPAQAP